MLLSQLTNRIADLEAAEHDEQTAGRIRGENSQEPRSVPTSEESENGHDAFEAGERDAHAYPASARETAYAESDGHREGIEPKGGEQRNGGEHASAKSTECAAFRNLHR